MTFSAKKMIKQRKSVRTFDGKTLSDEDRKNLENYIHVLTNPFEVPVEFCLLDAKEHQLSSPVIVGEHTYLAAKVKREEHFEIAFGYSFEKACLYARSLGIGTVMLAASLSRSAFEKAMNVQEDEVLPVASPVGYPAEKGSIRENLMRKGLRADERIAFDELFFAGSFDKALTKEAAGEYTEALEMARLSPSATNKQPWRAVVDGNKVYFYEQKSIKDSILGDIQKVDVGIALCHFDLVMEENGVSGRFLFEDPQIKAPENVYYIASYERIG
ncbi:MAG: nitroreductase [Lachnospiraceae bacterium]|nr:nitroreductase [Lachnospiraceae bacterium]